MGDFNICPECGGKVHKLATCCPKCGKEVKLPWYKNYVVLSCILIAVINFCMSYGRMKIVDKVMDMIKISIQQ